MSDILTRLRNWTHAVDAVPASDLMDEAADEIDRLRLTIRCLAEQDATLTAEEREAMTAMQEIERLVSKSIKQHYECDDSWYSCPMSDGGCSNPTWDQSDCTCGASDYNETLDAIAAIIRGMLERLK